MTSRDDSNAWCESRDRQRVRPARCGRSLLGPLASLPAGSVLGTWILGLLDGLAFCGPQRPEGEKSGAQEDPAGKDASGPSSHRAGQNGSAPLPRALWCAREREAGRFQTEPRSARHLSRQAFKRDNATLDLVWLKDEALKTAPTGRGPPSSSPRSARTWSANSTAPRRRGRSTPAPPPADRPPPPEARATPPLHRSSKPRGGLAHPIATTEPLSCDRYETNGAIR